MLIAIASGTAYTAYRLFVDIQSGIFERFPLHAYQRVRPRCGAMC